MTIHFSNALKTARITAIKDFIDKPTSGDGGAKMQIWTGVCPTSDIDNPAAELGYTLLGEITLEVTAATVSDYTLYLNTAGMTAGNAIASGIAEWARILSDNPTGTEPAKVVMDVSIGTSNSPIIMADTNIANSV